MTKTQAAETEANSKCTQMCDGGIHHFVYRVQDTYLYKLPLIQFTLCQLLMLCEKKSTGISVIIAQSLYLTEKCFPFFTILRTGTSV